jgi:hypothetical protein
MRTVAIELNDSGIVIADAEERLDESPGYARAEPDRLRFGHEALARAKLEPSQTFSHYWQCLDTEPLTRRLHRARTQADLVHGHLQALWTALDTPAEAVVLVLPGTWSRDQIGLLLGIVDSLNIPVRGLVDASLAAAVPAAAAGLLHLDLHLHHAVLSGLSQAEDLTVTRVERVEEAGLAGFREDWARAIAQRFVRETRFDPLHRAETEQTLHDALPPLLDRLVVEGQTTVSLDAGATRYELSVSTADLTAAGASRVETLMALIRRLAAPGADTEVQLTARSASVPGLIEAIDTEPGFKSRRLPENAAVRGGLAYGMSIPASDAGVGWITSRAFDGDGETIVRSTGPGVAASDWPTHVLCGHRAYPIGERPLLVGRAPESLPNGLCPDGDLRGVSREHCSIQLTDSGPVLVDRSRYGTYLNGQSVQGEAHLTVGDRIRLGTPGVELTLIREQGDGEAA